MGQIARDIEIVHDRAIEQRHEDRSRMVYRLVHVEVDDDEGLARCRNISDHGMKLEMSMPVRVGARLTVTFSASFQCIGRVVWTRGSECGLSLDCPIDAGVVLRHSASDTGVHGLRELRIKKDLPARIVVDGCTHETLSSDVSQYGMRLRHDGAFRAGLHVLVVLGSACERPGLVRWSDGAMADVVLLEPFSVTELGSAGALALH